MPLAKLACRVMLGEKLAEMDLPQERQGLGFGDHISVKEAVLPFDRFENSDAVLGPEMRSTGEVMGIARDFPTAFAKAQAAAGVPLPSSGTAFITVTDEDKAGGVGIAQTLHDCGFRIVATRGTAEAISRMGVPVAAHSTRSARAPPTSSTGSNAATSTWSSTRRRASAPAPTGTRSAAPR